jgi:uncharacterized protein
MSRHPAFRSLGDLPPALPVFPLTGVLLLPAGKLPLNIFEPRYLAMVQDVLGGDRLIGMVQPLSAHRPAEPLPALRPVGCAGRIVSFTETDDGRFLITLVGICRFRLGPELPMQRGYRQVTCAWDDFIADLRLEPTTPQLDRKRLEAALRPYLRQHGISVDWEALRQAPDEGLVASLAMIFPFDPLEKQALLEAPGPQRRADLLLGFLERACLTDEGQSHTAH